MHKNYSVKLRWLDWIFLGGYLPSLNINFVAMSKDMEKRFPQLYYIKMKNSHDWVLLQFLHVILSTPTNFTFSKKPLDKFLYKFDNPEINRQ